MTNYANNPAKGFGMNPLDLHQTKHNKEALPTFTLTTLFLSHKDRGAESLRSSKVRPPARSGEVGGR